MRIFTYSDAVVLEEYAYSLASLPTFSKNTHIHWPLYRRSRRIRVLTTPNADVLEAYAYSLPPHTDVGLEWNPNGTRMEPECVRMMPVDAR